MATQPYLDATKNGTYTTPAEWNTLANSWEASAFDADKTAEWVDAGVIDVPVATSLMGRGVLPSEAALVSVYFSTRIKPPLADAILAISILSAASAGGASFSEPAIDSFLDDIFVRLAATSVSVS